MHESVKGAIIKFVENRQHSGEVCTRVLIDRNEEAEGVSDHTTLPQYFCVSSL